MIILTPNHNQNTVSFSNSSEIVYLDSILGHVTSQFSRVSSRELGWIGSAVRAGGSAGFETQPRGRHGSSPAHLNFPQFDGPEHTTSKLILAWTLASVRTWYRLYKHSGRPPWTFVEWFCLFWCWRDFVAAPWKLSERWHVYERVQCSQSGWLWDWSGCAWLFIIVSGKISRLIFGEDVIRLLLALA